MCEIGTVQIARTMTVAGSAEREEGDRDQELQTNTEERIQAAAINTVSVVANWTLDTFFHHHHQTFSISDVLMTPHLFRIVTNYIEIFDFWHF